MANRLAEQFPKILEELFSGELPSYDTLLSASREALFPGICVACAQIPELKGSGVEEDIMQTTLIRIMKNSERQFFCRPGRKERNEDPQEFYWWAKKISQNCLRDFAKKARGRMFMETSEADAPIPDSAAPSAEVPEEMAERLRQAFRVVMESNAKLHIVLCWLAVSLIVLLLNTTRIRSTEKVAECCEKLTLNEMFDVVLRMAGQIEWMELDAGQVARIRQRLANPIDGIAPGTRCFGEFFMKGGAKVSISNWVNRMNTLVGKRMNG